MEILHLQFRDRTQIYFNNGEERNSVILNCYFFHLDKPLSCIQELDIYFVKNILFLLDYLSLFSCIT